MEEKNSAVELNNKLRQELVSASLDFFLLIMQTVNNSVTLDFRLQSPFIFLARQSYAIALLIAFAFLYIPLLDCILVSFVTYVLHSLILFISSIPFSPSLFSSFYFSWFHQVQNYMCRFT
jgi:hypothetical protein